jgi:broad specificity phosphatase PhoE
MSDDYDQLSALGQRQSRLLGEYYVRLGVTFDRAIAGPKKRHAQTAAEVAAAYAAAGKDFPRLEFMQEFDEFQADELVAHSVSELSTQYVHLKHLHEAYAAAVERHEASRNFQKFMEAVTLLWAQADFESPNVEPWAGFRDRVRAGIDCIREESASGSRVAVFSSGGPAAVAVQYALDMTAEKTLELIWTLRNAAVVEFLYTANRFTLSAFNNAAHLETPDFWTYR